MSEPESVAPFRSIYQLCYVTNDFARAQETFRTRHGVPAFKDMGEIALKLDGGGEARIRFALCFVGPTQLEIIEPRGGDDAVYRSVLPPSGFALVWHHVAFKMPSLAALEETRAGVTAGGHRIALSGGDPKIARFFYVDARDTLGHHVEYLYLSPEREALHAALPRY